MLIVGWLAFASRPPAQSRQAALLFSFFLPSIPFVLPSSPVPVHTIVPLSLRFLSILACLGSHGRGGDRRREGGPQITVGVRPWPWIGCGCGTVPIRIRSTLPASAKLTRAGGGIGITHMGCLHIYPSEKGWNRSKSRREKAGGRAKKEEPKPSAAQGTG